VSKLIENSISISDALEKIHSEKYVMPAFQRQFVWTMEQIEKLWDSILLDFPISTFLYWHVDYANTNNNTKFCRFMKDVTFDSRKQSDSPNYNLEKIELRHQDTAVLDGQQRLTSFYISLYGQASIRPKHGRRNSSFKTLSDLYIELNENRIDTSEEEAYNSKIYDIKFSEKIGRLSPTQFKIKELMNDKFKNLETRADAIKIAILNVPLNSEEYATGILNKLCEKIYDEKLIRYTEIFDMKQDEALEIFVRFNSGGKNLKKSEISMSILSAYWPDAKTKFGELLNKSYIGFDTDFIIRTALMLYGDVIKSSINADIVNSLKNEWKEFVKTLEKTKTLLSNNKINLNRFYSSWNVLLPIIYFIHYNKDSYFENEKDIIAYLVRAIFFTYFQSGTTSKLQQMKSNINNNDYKITIEMLNQMNELRVTEAKIEDILNYEKGSRVAGEVLYYLSKDWINSNYKYEQDHLHPASRFDENKPPSISIEDWKNWRNNRNKIANLQLLEGRSNGSKNDMSLSEYYYQMNSEQQNIFLKQSLISPTVSLDFSDFDMFYQERLCTMTDKIRQLLNGKF
jgi:uncharacterized protein with ParB-like and HNH nuclease domain